jgi:2-polyprenyl-3-methyl-5-hydroxy-6-metoxy-1,4-benzoquinol methylase|tara:strand:+ start:377 stop:1279 length:903 start_codon:yes stop_codon:yes gene_type:complete
MKFKNKNFTINEEIINFKIESPVTSKVKKFYELDPFPNYEINDDKGKILKIADGNIFLKSLKNFIGFNKNIIEFGSGTCQLSNYLAIGTNNDIYAFDSSFNSLRIGKNFSKKNNINNITFINGDIFDEIFHPKVFDFIICSGVLHHTKDPYGGFVNIVKNLKKEGYILVGLYNKIGRIRTKIRKYIYKILGKNMIMILDPVLRKTDKKSHDKINAWIKDQYQHPVESTHTFDEILKWFDSNNIEFINSIPQCSMFETENEDYFQKKSKATFVVRIIKQIFMIFSRFGSEGGLFIVIGKKK